MHFTTAVSLLFASATALAAPARSANDSPAEIVARSTCPSANLFVNPGFNSPASQWYLPNKGDGTSGGVQSQWFPVNWPSNGAPTAYALNFTIPAGQSRTVSLEQKIGGAGIIDGHSYQIGFNLYPFGTTSATCTAIYYAGVGDAFPTQLRMPPVQANPPSGYFYQQTFSVPGNNYQSLPADNIAGSQFTCTAGSTAATVTIVLDNASLIDQC